MRIETIEKIKQTKQLQTKNQNNKTHPFIQLNPKEIDSFNSFNQIFFTRRWKEHKSWGAVVDPDTKDVSFKIFVYPDTKKVDVEIIDKDGNLTNYPLQNKGEGVFETQTPIKSEQAKTGYEYHFKLYKNDGSTVNVKDPYSFCQNDFLGNSVIFDHSTYSWNDADWKKNEERILNNRIKKPKSQSVKNLRIYELNIASLTKEGNFEGAKKKLDEIKNMGFNAIEIMPIENTFSFNWGYDGVDKLAASAYLGGADKLKELIDEAHFKGLNVIMDMVPNHVGPDGEQLNLTGPYLKGKNDFGFAFNFEGKDSKYVRDYIVNCALNWLDNFHCDGLRLDMTKYMESDCTMKQIASEINYHIKDAFLIAEDSREKTNANDFASWHDENEPHDKRVTRSLTDDDIGINLNEDDHDRLIDITGTDKNPNSLLRLGYDSEWDFNFFHSLNNFIFSKTSIYKLLNAIYHSQDAVKYVMSHDEIGNKDGTRLISKLVCDKLNLKDNVNLNDEDYKRINDLYDHWTKDKKPYEIDVNKLRFETYNTVKIQKAELITEELIQNCLTGKFDEYKTKPENAFFEEVLRPMGINSYFTLNDLIKNYEDAYDINKTALALTYSIPGPKMVFQGDENADMTSFRFFRQFSNNDEEYLKTEKGYPQGLPALQKSTLGILEYDDNANKKMDCFLNLTKDLNALNVQNTASSAGIILEDESYINEEKRLIGFSAYDNETDNQLFLISNFGPESQNNIKIRLPKGKWEEILNTDDVKYGGLGTKNPNILEGTGEYNTNINIQKNSAIILKKIN